MRKKILFLVLSAFLLVAPTVKALDIVQPSKDNPNVTIGNNQTHRNLYTAGSNVSINGNTLGDLVAAGGMVTVSGDVENEAIIAGGSLNLSGSIGGHARIAGGNITINGPIGGDLVIGGGNVSITGKSSVSGDLLAGTGNLTIDAPVNGTARIAGGNITINNRIAGDVYVRATQKLVFGSNAEVLGKVVYTGPSQAVVESGAKVGSIQYTPYAKPQGAARHAAGIFTALFFISLAAWLITGFILNWLFRGMPRTVAEETYRYPWSNLGIGLVGLIITPIVIVLLLLTVVGYYIAALLGIIYALFIMLSAILGAVSLGYLILRYLIKPAEIVYWQMILIGVVVWFLVGLIPIIGWIVKAVVFLMVFGTLMRLARQRFLTRTPRPAA